MVHQNNNNNNNNNTLVQRIRTKLARIVFVTRINYRNILIFIAALFLISCLVLTLMLPNNALPRRRSSSYKFSRKSGLFDNGGYYFSTNLSFLNELDSLGDNRVVKKFEPSLRRLDGFREYNEVLDHKLLLRFWNRKPKLALVFGDFGIDAHQIKMVTLADALLEIGYEIEVFTLEDGPANAIWREIKVPISIISAHEMLKIGVDWLNYHGILVNSLKAVDFVSCLMQEPFRNVPLVWTIHEGTLATRLKQYVSSIQGEQLIDHWRNVFSRPSVVVFPSHILRMAYSECDTGNYYVIPGLPEETCKADKNMFLLRYVYKLIIDIEYEPIDFVVAIVGSRLSSYRELWLENAFVLKALYRFIGDFGRYSSSPLKIVVLAGDSSSNSSTIVETITQQLGYPNGTVKHFALDENTANVINTAYLVIYGSFLDESTFPEIFRIATCNAIPVIAPDLPSVRKYVTDEVNGYLFRKDNLKALTNILNEIIAKGELSTAAYQVASNGKEAAKNLMVSETLEGYASLLEKILTIPSEVSLPRDSMSIPMTLKSEWEWYPFNPSQYNYTRSFPIKDMSNILDKFENKFNDSDSEISVVFNPFVYTIWDEQERIDKANMRKGMQDEEIKDRTKLVGGTWDKIYRNVRRPARTFHERYDEELERTGQPLCIYEPYLGVGTWPFLHLTSLYRGIDLSSKGRRPGTDDIDGPSRLPLLNDPYYRDVLGEYGAFFAIANRIDRTHKNAWIGFHSWRATATNKSLSGIAERSLLDAIEAQRHGDALYFWARSDKDLRNPMKQDFWSFCDSINAGNCQFVFSEAMIRMYNISHKTHSFDSLPPMPTNNITWSVMHSWALPTKSFMEFAMFSRMFVNALDAKFHDDHLKNGSCYLSLSKDKQCYSRLLELLVNVWAYHSARRMIYVNPETGFMQEQHMLESRRGRMWIHWFQFSTLKSMDEELAEASDLGYTKGRWLWPITGEVFYQGMYEKEKEMRIKEKEEKKQRTRERIRRMKKHYRQEVIGEYVKFPSEESNLTSELPLSRRYTSNT